MYDAKFCDWVILCQIKHFLAIFALPDSTFDEI